MAPPSASWLVCFSLGVLACESKTPPKPIPAASASAAPTASTVATPLPTGPRRAPRAAGPRLAILAGEGVGAVRLGATVETIERLMQRPCELKTETACRYIDLAVDFMLENGTTTSIRAFRPGRPAGKDANGVESEYGYFNGAIPPDLMFGMIPKAIQEQLGQPSRVEHRDVVGPANHVETHYYDGLTLEYDRHTNGNLILGEAIVTKRSGNPSESSARPARSGSSPAKQAPPAPAVAPK